MCRVMKIAYLVAVAVILLSGCTNSEAITEQYVSEMGNTNGNIHQMGYAVEKDGWIYYSSFDDSDGYDSRGCLYRKRKDGSEKQRLSNNLAYQINVLGDFVYYISGEPGPIYKVNKNGGKKQKLENRRSSNLIVLGDEIFYRLEYEKLYKMNTDGKEKKKLADDMLEFSIYEGNIYYTNQNDNHLYKMDLNGNNVQKLSNHYAKDINVEGNWVYFWDFNDSMIYKLKTDGSEEKMLTSPTDKCGSLNLYNGVLYFRNIGSLNTLTNDGEKKEKLLEGNIVNINIVDDFIIYYQVTEEEGYYKVNLDGTGKEKLGQVV